MELLDYITDEDYKTLTDWIEINQQCKVEDIRKVFKYWNKNKRTMFNLLGRKLRYKIPIEVEADQKIVLNRIQELYVSPRFKGWGANKLTFEEALNHDFIIDVMDYILSMPHHYNFTLQEWVWDDLSIINGTNFSSTTKSIEALFAYVPMIDGATYLDFEIAYKDKKTLLLPKGMKIMRALQKFLKYIEYPNMYLFENFRNAMSDITTQTQIKANLVLSIHPLDFLTLSDNNCGWRSCMAMDITNQGEYSSSITEMMNSNCVIVAYLESVHKKFSFNFHEIPNKSWRQLVYCHKDIICTGKSYPYTSDALSQKVLSTITELAKENLNWNYQYKNQLYKDFTNFQENADMRDSYIPEKLLSKKMILLYSIGYYNDFIADDSINYYCNRNYVHYNKRICVSGPATCLVCGDKLIENTGIANFEELHSEDITRDIYGDYSICEYCLEFKCDCCNRVIKDNALYMLPTGIYSDIICEDCLKEYRFFIDADERQHYEHYTIAQRLDGTWHKAIDGDINNAKEHRVDLSDSHSLSEIRFLRRSY